MVPGKQSFVNTAIGMGGNLSYNVIPLLLNNVYHIITKPITKIKTNTVC